MGLSLPPGRWKCPFAEWSARVAATREPPPGGEPPAGRSVLSRFRGSLRAKALALFAALALLVAAEIVLAIAVFGDVEQHFAEFAALDSEQRQLVVSVVQVRDLLLDIDLAAPNDDRRAVLEHWLSDLDVLLDVDAGLADRLGPEAIGLVAALGRRGRELLASPSPTHDSVVALGEDIHADVQEYGNALLAHMTQVQNETEELAAHAARHRRDYVATMAGLGGLGLVILALGGGMFLSRLLGALDLLRLQARRIAGGDYGQAIPVARSDEIGEVVRAVNAMSVGLAARERELAGLRGRFGQQERMFAMGVLAAQMAHELGNPIQAIMALSLHASESLRGDQSRENVLANLEHLDLIAEHAERLTGTVCEIREFGRPARMDREFVDLNEIVRSTVRLMRFERRFARAKVELDLSADIPAVYGLADHLAQVLVNLLINAADAVPGAGGWIAVRTAVEDGWVAVRVSDNGHGMEEAVKGLVFEPFFSTKHNENGTGLGLTICKQIIEDHEGRIGIDSTAAEGTTVTVLLPRG